MIATVLVALFATVAVASAVTLTDAVVRSRNAFRLLRGDLARIDSLRQVTVRFEDEEAPLRIPALRIALLSQRSTRRTVRTPQQLRAAA